VGTAWALYHHKFALQYIPKFQAAAIEYLQKVPDVEVRKFEKDSLDKITIHLHNLLRRVYTVLERQKIVENLELMLSTILLKSNYLQRRIDGLKALNEIIRGVTVSISQVITADFLANWIQSHKIIDEFFGSRRHQQIIQRSVPIVTFMFTQRLLTKDIMEKMWENTQDEQFKQDIFKVIREAAFPVTSPELKFFISKIAELNPSMLCEEALDIICDARKGNNQTEAVLEYSKILANIALDNSYPLPISEKALEKLAEMVADLSFIPYKKETLRVCVKDMLQKVNQKINNRMRTR
jgi:hypothetical protein